LGVTSSFVFGGLGLLTVVVAVSLGTGEAGTGVLNAAMGVGGLVGAAVAGVIAIRSPLAGVLLGGTAVTAIGVALFGFSPSLALASIALAIAAAGGLVVDVASTTLFQRAVPDAVRGRVLGAVETAGVAAFIAGSLALPIFGTPERLGLLLLACAVILLAGAVAGVVLVGRSTTPPAVDAMRERALQLPIFAGVPPSALEESARRMHSVPVAAGESVIRQGDAPDRFYVVVDGRFDVSIADERGLPRHVRTLGADAVFGEIGLLADSPRTATVTAATAGRLLALERADFLELVRASPGLTPRLLDLHRGARRVTV
jgi:MFS family permease